ncbi:MAG: CoA transferase [Comamonadaceae bacterium]|nr:MAG: CoA transferase [Comamonadaceae bacterium]
MKTDRRPLSGVRVVDFSMHMAGPFCTRALADLGADVIKVEPPAGDNMRNMMPMREGVSSYFGNCNAGKRSVVLDLKNGAERDAARRLVQTADVVIENGRPGSMAALGLGFADVYPDNTRLIYLSISGYGQEGPGSQRPAYAMTIHAESGLDLANMAYQDGQDRPSNVGIFTADYLAGVYSFSAVLAALYDREKTGLGQLLDVALMDCVLNMLMYEVQESQFPAKKQRNVYKPLRTSDGYIMLPLVTQKNFMAMFDAIGRSDMKTDPRFSTAAARMESWNEIFTILDSITFLKSTDEMLQVLNAAGVPVARYRQVRETLNDPQLQSRGALSTVSDRVGSFTVMNQPFLMSNASISANSHAPSLGEHNAEIFAEIGYKPGASS